MKNMNKIECFKIQIIESNQVIDFSNFNSILQIKCSIFSGICEPTTIVADPFLFVKKDTLYLFYECKKMYHNGVISMIKTNDLVHWSKPVTVLKESCHLSYPWVFEENGHIYMVPETCILKEIRLYEGNNELSKFSYVKTILKDNKSYSMGFSFSDTSIYKVDKYYYLMTTINDGINNILKLYISDRLDGIYKEHPMSPICSNNKYGRNAGSLFELDGKLYRVAQNCENSYGDNVNILEIVDITTMRYKENIFKDNILPIDIQYYKKGGHQLNFVKFKEKNIIATDAKEYHYFILNRLLHRIGCYK